MVVCSPRKNWTTRPSSWNPEPEICSRGATARTWTKMGMGVPWVSGILCSEDVKPKKGTHLKSPPRSPIVIWAYKTQVPKWFCLWFYCTQMLVFQCANCNTLPEGSHHSSWLYPITLPWYPYFASLDPSQQPPPSPAAHLRNPQATAFLGALCRLQKDGTSALAPDVASGPGTLLPQVWGLVHPTNWVKGRTANVLWVSKACKILDPHPTWNNQPTVTTAQWPSAVASKVLQRPSGESMPATERSTKLLGPWSTWQLKNRPCRLPKMTLFKTLVAKLKKD